MLNKKQIAGIKKYLIRTTNMERFPFIFNALGDQGRFRIFNLLTERNDLCVTDIANIFGISVPAASQQLRILEMTGLVRKERIGQTICYEVKIDDSLVKLLTKVFHSRSGFIKSPEIKIESRANEGKEQEKVLLA